MSVLAFSSSLSVSRKLLRVGFVGVSFLGLLVAGRAESLPTPTDGESDVPADLRAALGWSVPAKENYNAYENGSAFAVKSDPAKWMSSVALTDAWVATAPEFARNPIEQLFRRMARIEALVLNATDPAIRSRLQKERVELVALTQSLRDTKPALLPLWQSRQLANAAENMNKRLGEWLADSTAERLAVFREELAALQPPDRTKLAAAYGGEEKLAALLVAAREYRAFATAVNTVRNGTDLTGDAKKQALAKAMSALGFFQGYHYDDKELGRLLNDDDLAGELAEDDGNARVSNITVPELVELTDSAGAEALLREVYALPVNVNFYNAPHTRELAKALVVAGKITPKRMPWALLVWPDETVNEAGAKELVGVYDVLRPRFTEFTKPGKTADSDIKNGLSRIAAALAGLGRKDEAAGLLQAAGQLSPDFPYHGSVDEAFAVKVWDFLAGSRGVDTNAEDWNTLSALAPQAERSEALVAFAVNQAKAAPADSMLATTWQSRQGWALVAADDPDAALAILVPIFERAPVGDGKDSIQKWTESAERLLKLAVALDKVDLAAKIRAVLLVNFKDAKGSFWENSSLFREFASEEIAASHAALIEQLLRNRLTAKPASAASLYEDDETMRNFSGDEYSAWLADVMARQGRHADVVKWLAESPYWSNRDLSQSLNTGSGNGWRPLALVAAESLHATGDDAKAITILEAYLLGHSASDPAYTLYTAIRGSAAIPFLDKLQAMDHYEERPLIWKANVLLAAGRIDDAETTVKQAIAIDPSDGGTPHGDRMRAYAVAREIALKKGDVKHAEFLGGVVAAIRQAEAADDLVEAGLISRAIVEYQQALYSFSDAYCIQSRLAIRLAGENRMDEAIEHYKKAYELMPDSFGRVESHCFGCEKAFAGEQPQAIAERVFAALIAKPPVKPQAFYLMGYLRMEQERWEEAAGYFTQAVEADPQYLNAWDKLSDVLPHTERPRAEQDRVAVQLFTLDPYQRHGSSGWGKVRDIPALWKMAAAVDRSGGTVPEKLYPLGNLSGMPSSGRSTYSHYRSQEDDVSPAGLVSQHEIVRMIVNELDSLYGFKQRM